MYGNGLDNLYQCSSLPWILIKFEEIGLSITRKLKPKPKLIICWFFFKWHVEYKLRFLIGTIHKWCHSILTQNWTPCPFCHAKKGVLLSSLYLPSHNCISQSPLLVWRHLWIAPEQSTETDNTNIYFWSRSDDFQYILLRIYT